MMTQTTLTQRGMRIEVDGCQFALLVFNEPWRVVLLQRVSRHDMVHLMRVEFDRPVVISRGGIA